jgi:hypothetical protein
MDPNTTEAVLEATLQGPIEAGVKKVDLARYGVRLATGVPYRWYVAVVPDPGRRSKDILAGGTIERVAPPAGLPEKLAQVPKEQVPFVYAEAGLWYDALAAMSALVERAPGDEALLQQRSALLSQVRLGAQGEVPKSR